MTIEAPGCLLSIDLEDYKQTTCRALRVAEVTDPEAAWRGLEALTNALSGLPGDVRMTFFSTGQIARDQPDLVRELVRRGHEVGCHSDRHDNIRGMTEESFRSDLRRASAAISDASERPVLGFRAPNFSVDGGMTWFLRVLAEEGFRYDSSLQQEARKDPRRPTDTWRFGDIQIQEFPIYKFGIGGGRGIRVIGGTYFRLLPLAAILHLVERSSELGFTPLVYLHFSDLWPGLRTVSYSEMAPLSSKRRLYWLARQFQWKAGSASTCGKLRAVLRKFPNRGPMVEGAVA